MDIKQLRYFIAIVDNHFNLTRAAELLYISQPTLSIMINEFESREGVTLFQRERGRIVGLTYSGERYYEDAKTVLEEYNRMLNNLHGGLKDIKGTITIGIPPFVLSVVFSTVMPKLILDNPDIKFIIREIGANSLKNELILGNVDIAVLLEPTGLPDNLIETFEIQHSELSLFVSPNHKLANCTEIRWSNLNKEKLAIFDSTFMINHYLNETFERLQIHPNIILTSGSWDFMLNSTKINPNIATILPNTIVSFYPSNDVKCIKINNPIPWRVVVTRLRKNTYSKIESYIIDSLVGMFNESKEKAE